MIREEILKELSAKDSLHSIQLEKLFNTTYEKLYAELISLQTLKYITLEKKQIPKLELTEEGSQYANEGTPEFKIYSLASIEGTAKEIVENELKHNYKFAIGKALGKKLVSLKDNLIFRSKEEVQDEDKIKLNLIRNQQQISKAEITALKKRNLVEDKQLTYFIITKGPEYREKEVELFTQLTSAMLADNSWEKYEFKQFNPEAKGLQIENGNLHLLLKTKQQFVEILLEMGFEEMQTDRYVESSFWNFDALFQPQAHPARDAHDTFFVSHPVEAKVHDKEYFEEVKKIHEKGGYGSIGYDYQWDPKQAYKNILRTHTTAVSSRYLREIAQEKEFKPRKFFSIDRVFRNESLDVTHLAEFHQVEGFIIDRNLGLHHLIGVLSEFYKKIGISDISFKPTYNPYTEPSMEIFGVHPILKKKVEIGNSGIFRPQMLRPMGFPEDVSVIAWGLGLERPTMIQNAMSNIKELFGPGVSLKKVKDSPIFCL